MGSQWYNNKEDIFSIKVFMVLTYKQSIVIIGPPFAHHERRPRKNDVLPVGDVGHHPEGGNCVIDVHNM
jgi:hypothetical protein